MRIVLVSVVILLTSAVSCLAFDKDQPPQITQNIVRAVQDPDTKVTYYIESDLRHVAAISRDGKFLWCCDVVGPPDKSRRGSCIAYIRLAGDNIAVAIWESGFGSGNIDKKTGVYTDSGVVD